MKTRKRESLLEGWMLPIAVAAIGIITFLVYDAGNVEESKSPRYAKGVAAFNTFLRAAERVADKTGDKRARELALAADYYTEVRAADSKFRTVIRRRWILSNFMLVGFLQSSDVTNDVLRDEVRNAAAMGMITKDNGTIFIHESAAAAKPSYLRGLIFLHGMNEAERRGGTFLSLLSKPSLAEEVRSTQEMLNIAALVGGEPYRKSLEDAALFSGAGVEGSAIIADFSAEIGRMFEAETLAERYAVNQLFILHIAFRKAEVKWKDSPEQAIAEKYQIMKKVIRFLEGGKGKQV
ncbi:hypothetical protein HY622_03285 [Candidatus Uhrbacteria bacterium]|nr:hypothetical protein [Candidatus Uhrbacteria bacterium]